MHSTGAVRAPATRDQVDAYRFGLRRMEAALVRGDLVLAALARGGSTDAGRGVSAGWAT